MFYDLVDELERMKRDCV